MGGAGGLRRLLPAASVPGIACSERGALPTCPRRPWQATACRAWQVLHTGCLARCNLPWLRRGAVRLTASHPLLGIS